MPQPDPVPSSPPLARLSAERRAEIRQRLAAATPGPWVSDPLNIGLLGDVSTLDGECVAQTQERVGPTRNARLQQRQCDADLIAHAPSDLAALLDELERRDALLGVKARLLVERLVTVAEAPDGAALARMAGPVTHAAADAVRLLDALLGGGGGGQPQTPGDGQ